MRINKTSKVILLVSILLFAAKYSMFSQNTDELLQQLTHAKGDKQFIEAYNNLGNNLKYDFPDSAMAFYKKSLKISLIKGDLSSKADVLVLIGTVYSIKNDYDSAIYYINRGLKLYKKLKNDHGEAHSLNKLGLAFMQKENLDESKNKLFLAKEKSVVLRDTALLSEIYNNIGMLFNRKHDYDSALYFYHQSLKINEELDDFEGVAQTTNNIALIYESISEFELALKYLNQSYKIRKKNNNRYGEAIVLNNFGLVYESQGEIKLALLNYLKALEIMNELKDITRIPMLHYNIGSVYVKLKDFKTGFEYLQKGLEINKEMDNVLGQIYGTVALAHFYENLKIYQNAITEYKKALYLSESIDDIALRSEIHEGLYTSYEMYQRFDSALFYYKKYAHLNDSIFNTYSHRNIEKLEIEYQSLKKEKENQDLIRQNQIKEEDLKRLLLIGAILLLILASIIVFGIFSIRSKQKLERTYQLVVEQRNSIQTQSFELADAYKKLQEFSNFKEELTSMIVHDLKNPLNIILNVAKINNYPDKDQVMLQSGKQMLNLVMNILDVYKYEGKSFMLEPKSQYINPLIEKVKNDMSFVLSEKSIKIKIAIDYDFMVKIDETAFERVIVNLLTNAIKFSPQGSVILIHTEALKNNKFRLHIIDKGEGIAGENINQIFLKFEQRESRKLGYSGSTGIGLTYCKMAIEAHGGIIGVESELGKGADFYIEMDYTETKESELIETNQKGNYLLLSRDNRRLLYPYILALQEKDIYEVTDIRNILKLISSENKELQQFCSLIENSVLNCNQIMFDELLELALTKE